MRDSHTSVEIRSGELYDYAKKDKLISTKFYNQRGFNQFLRKQHNEGYLKQIIPNCRVDDTNKEFYKWYFRKKSKPKKYTKKSSGINGNYIHFRNDLNIQTSDNNFVRSEQEKMIYESLIKFEELNIVYDYPLIHKGKRKNVDFFIENLKDNTEYYWEHFGMTNNEGYLSKIPKILTWYKNAGINDISEKNGNLIFSYYKNLGVFQREIDKNISQILNTKILLNKEKNENPLIPFIEVYLSAKVDYESSKGLYSLLLKHERNNLKHQKTFKKSFYLASEEKIILTGILDGLKKLKKPSNIKIYLNSDKLIKVLNREDIIKENSDLVNEIVAFSYEHKLSFRKIVNPMRNRFYMETIELLMNE